MERFSGTVVRLLAGILLAMQAGCGSAKLFGVHPEAESPDPAGFEWPRLVDTPAAPPKGQYSAAVPDPAQGTAVEVELHIAARAAQERAEATAMPVLTEDERRRLAGRR
jgi:hypothetical protein